ncbi:MAG: serine hydrolase domain-containing protein [Lacibacter sp.]
MKKNYSLLLLFAAVIFSSCRKDIYSTPAANISGSIPVNEAHPMKDSLTSIVHAYLAKGIPGVQVMVKNADGLYIVNGGYAKVEDKTPMRDNMTAWLYSITKTYTAVLALKLQEKGLLKLDTTADAYISPVIMKHIANGSKVTVRQLLNHTGGLPNHTEEPAYMMAQFNNPFNQPDLQKQLEYIYDKPSLFTPGTDFFYSNSGYALMQMVIEKVTGKTYNQVLREEILLPFNLSRTYIGLSEDQLQILGFPNYYFERYNNGQLENVTKWNNSLAQKLGAYGGIAANGTDVIKFMEALMNGNIISNASLQQMRTWVQGKESTEPDYGLGLEYYGRYNDVTPTVTYGHEGDGLGGTTQIIYIPSKQTCLFITINAGRQIFGEYLFKTTDFKIDLCKYVASYQ